jgi:hypothetical protein
MALGHVPYRVPFSLPVLAGKKSDAEKPPDLMPPIAALSATFFTLSNYVRDVLKNLTKQLY